MQAGKTVARFLPLYFLLRGRVTEALQAHARLTQSPVPGAADALSCRLMHAPSAVTMGFTNLMVSSCDTI